MMKATMMHSSQIALALVAMLVAVSCLLASAQDGGYAEVGMYGGMEDPVTTRPDGPSARNTRFCEILLTFSTPDGPRTDFWGTPGLNLCPAEQFDQLTVAGVMEETGATDVILNGPRYFLTDGAEISGSPDATGETMTFGPGQLEAGLLGVVGPLGEDATGSVLGEAYVPFEVVLDTTAIYWVGSEVYVLTDPDGNKFVMLSYAQVLNPDLTVDDLSSLGDVLNLPDGWIYEAGVLAEELVNVAAGLAPVVTDDMLNAYQQLPEGVRVVFV